MRTSAQIQAELVALSPERRHAEAAYRSVEARHARLLQELHEVDPDLAELVASQGASPRSTS